MSEELLISVGRNNEPYHPPLGSNIDHRVMAPRSTIALHQSCNSTGVYDHRRRHKERKAAIALTDPASRDPAIEVLVIRPRKGWTMKRRFSDEQIIGMIKEYEAGVKAQELCRRYGISDATFYKYKAKFGGMNVSDAKKLRALE
ncbi:Transposase [Roseovarius albus]|uniref:Transposase n=1 Tax=Roseovarius albus TaxID=1247867 RepID=A0A1X6Y818_9RHOB|nr:Transposase [Roseovarius albus]